MPNTVFHKPINYPTKTTIASPYTAGSGTLVVTDGTSFGSPSPTSPLRISVFSSTGTPKSILEITARSGNTLTVSKTLDGVSDVNLITGDFVESRVTSGTLTEIHTAVNTLETGITDEYIFPSERTFLLGVRSPVVVGTNVLNPVIMTRSGKFVKSFISAKTGPTGANLIVDININGVSIWNTTQANRLKIVAGGTTGNQSSFDTTVFTEGDVITVDIDQVGSTIAGQDISVQVLTFVKNNTP